MKKTRLNVEDFNELCKDIQKKKQNSHRGPCLGEGLLSRHKNEITEEQKLIEKIMKEETEKDDDEDLEGGTEDNRMIEDFTVGSGSDDFIKAMAAVMMKKYGDMKPRDFIASIKKILIYHARRPNKLKQLTRKYMRRGEKTTARQVRRSLQNI